MLRQLALTAKRTMTRAGDVNSGLDVSAAIRERPPPRKRIPVLTLPDRVQNMCPAYLARHAWPLALMRSADRVPINFTGFDALRDFGFSQSPATNRVSSAPFIPRDPSLAVWRLRRCSNRRILKSILSFHDRPGDPGELVGQCRRNKP